MPLALHAQPDSTVFDDLLFNALQGDVATVLSGLDTLDDAGLRPGQVTMKQGFQQRFRGQEDFDYRTAEPAVRAVMDIYRGYWRAALLDKAGLAQHDSALAKAVTTHLMQVDPTLARKGRKAVRDNWNDLLQEHLKAHGAYAQTGRTGPLYDLLMHARQTRVRYPVITPEDTLEVTVVFMDSVLTNGWEGFATFDTYYPGGWATDDALYCVRTAYDTTSEQFAVSYVMHEGKHFADYKRFPKLAGTDLEYRAKLVELGAAREDLYGLITFFLRNNSTDRSDAHGFANRCVMRDLSRRLFQQERMDDLAAWKRLPVEDIHRASTALLLEHTKALRAAGAAKVESVLKP
jgi:hypothetical protein